MSDQRSLITAAGGNGTAIEVIPQPLSRPGYVAAGRLLGEKLKTAGAEQAGFLIPDRRHFEMAGGEFCGNANLAAAVLLFEATGGQESLNFTVSGFDAPVRARVQRRSPGLYQVRCEFPGLPVRMRSVTFADGTPAAVVDLDGIVHVVIEGTCPKDPADYEQAHTRITTECGLTNRNAVGVTWYQREQDTVTISPVVWVRAVETFFHETSCGSGSIAAAMVTRTKSIVQPTGKVIEVEIKPGLVSLTSEMEVVLMTTDVSYVTAGTDTPEFMPGFVAAYQEAYGGAPYFEHHEPEEILDQVWWPHIRDGLIVLALADAGVAGFGCALPLTEAPSDIQDFLREQQSAGEFQVNFATTWYMSELGVIGGSRRHGIGSQLVSERLRLISNQGGTHYVLRTAAAGSNSRDLYERMGATALHLPQDVSGLDQIRVKGSQSAQRVYLFGQCARALTRA